jgi:hypothetical protein
MVLICISLVAKDVEHFWVLFDYFALFSIDFKLVYINYTK